MLFNDVLPLAGALSGVLVGMKLNEGWGASVSVVGRNTVVVRIESVEEALRFMRDKWPGASTLRFAKARRLAVSAIAGMCDVEDARNAFVAACSEADCVIRTEGC